MKYQLYLNILVWKIINIQLVNLFMFNSKYRAPSNETLIYATIINACNYIFSIKLNG